MEEILIVSNYYPPEKGAASNRIEQLAIELQENNYSVYVVCPLPNYPEGKIFDNYKNSFSKTEKIKNITVKRLWIYPSNSKNIAKRVLSILSFSFCLMFFLSFSKIPKKVVVQSPPLLLSFVAVFVLFIRKRKIILNVSDLWPLAAIELRALKRNSFSHKVLLYLEKFIYKKATVILAQSNEIITHIKKTTSVEEIYLYRNYPKINSSFSLEKNSEAKTHFFYAGLLGVAQGVLSLCKNVNWNQENVVFHIYGDGAEKEQIITYINENKIKNILFHGLLTREALHNTIRNYDVAIVPLKTRIYGSVPSKIFEYGCLGFPMIYSGGGEGEQLIKDYKLGWIASSHDYSTISKLIEEISKKDTDAFYKMKQEIYSRSVEVFNIKNQMKALFSKGVF